MERKGVKEIGKYLGIYLIYAVIFSGAIYFPARHGAAVRQQQMLTLMINHPELEEEIIALWEKPFAQQLSVGENGEKVEKAIRIIEEKYGYDFESSTAAPVIWYAWGVGLALGFLITGALGYADTRKKRKGSISQEKAEALYECLEQFRHGDFQEIPDAPEEPLEWMRLWESVRELGNYFADLKVRLAEEEDSTKALITDISHQLKTPLASLRMCCELASDEALTQEERREFQVQEGKEIEKLEMLVDELMKLSRLEAQMIQIHPAAESIKKTITDAVSQIYVKAKNKNIEIQVEMDEDIQLCHDSKWTSEALENVLDNAVKYSQENTVITVRIIRLVQNLLIEIEDEGMGIDPEELHKIYHRFYRGSKARDQVKEGAGVGLYLARRILEQQGGTISAKRRSGPGTSFKITLPLCCQ